MIQLKTLFLGISFKRLMGTTTKNRGDLRISPPASRMSIGGSHAVVTLNTLSDRLSSNQRVCSPFFSNPRTIRAQVKNMIKSTNLSFGNATTRYRTMATDQMDLQVPQGEDRGAQLEKNRQLKVTAWHLRFVTALGRVDHAERESRPASADAQVCMPLQSVGSTAHNAAP